MKPCQNEAIIILFAPKHFVEFSFKALMTFKVIQKYWKLKEMQFLPLPGRVRYRAFMGSEKLYWIEFKHPGMI